MSNTTQYTQLRIAPRHTLNMSSIVHNSQQLIDVFLACEETTADKDCTLSWSFYRAKLAVDTNKFKKGDVVDRLEFLYQGRTAEIYDLDVSENEPVEIIRLEHADGV